MTATLEFKRGATFRLPFSITDDDGNPEDTTGWTVTCHIRRESGDGIVAVCTIEAVDESVGSYVASVEVDDADYPTSAWGLGAVYSDIRAVSADETTRISETISFVVVKEATRS